MNFRRTFLTIIVTMLVTCLLLVVFTRQQKAEVAATSLGIELVKGKSVLYLPASLNSKALAAHIPVSPTADATSLAPSVTAVRVIPRMEGNKVKVEIYAVFGNIDASQNCAARAALKSSLIATRLAGKGEVVTVVELDNLGLKPKDGPLTFRVVSNTLPLPSKNSDDCICAVCSGIGCCPDGEGRCPQCSACGEVCCMN